MFHAWIHVVLYGAGIWICGGLFATGIVSLLFRGAEAANATEERMRNRSSLRLV